MKKNFLDYIVVAAVVLVPAQTFIEDLAVVLDWQWTVRRALIFSGFAFDVFFTAEFLVRLYAAAINRRTGEYITHGRGWVDFFASVPLVVLSSGPAVLGLLAGGVPMAAPGGGLDVLMAAAAMRMARFLRIFRILKIFRYIGPAGSVKAERNIAGIAAIAVTVFVFSLIGGPGGRILDGYPASASYLASEVRRAEDASGRIMNFARVESGLLLVRQEGKTLYSRYTASRYAGYFGPFDYTHYREGPLELFFSLKPLNIGQSRTDLFRFIVIMVLVPVFLVYNRSRFRDGGEI